MAKQKFTPEDLQAIHDLAHTWGKIVCRQAFGDQGPGLDVDLTTMEEVAVAALRGLLAGTLESATAQQAAQLGTHQPCPDCGQDCPVRHEPREVTTRGGPFAHHEPVCHCTRCRRDFFPQRLPLKLDGHAYSPAVLLKMAEAAAHVKSFDVAAKLLQRTAEFTISGRHLNRIVEEIGAEMRDARDRRTEDYVHHRRRPLAEPAPHKVALGVDGGRLNTRQTGHGGGVHEPGWREDKVGCLQVLEGPIFTMDPQAQPPACFLDKEHVQQMVKDFQQQKGLPDYDEPEATLPSPVGQPEQPPPAPGTDQLPTPAGAPGVAQPEPCPAAAAVVQPVPAPSSGALAATPAWPPQRLARTCVASLAESHSFAKLLAAEAYARGFFAADLRAFLGDGLAYNWKIHQHWFADFTPILDFVHPLAYLYATAGALASHEERRWALYVRWLTASWQGGVQEVLVELRQGQGRLEAELGRPAGKLPANDPREVVRRALNYLENNASRMDYPRYRRLGLPVTSSAVESLIKEVNYRVKGSEKFWNDPEGAEAILQVRAAVLSEDDRLAAHIHNRPGHAYRRRTPAPVEEMRPAA